MANLFHPHIPTETWNELLVLNGLVKPIQIKTEVVHLIQYSLFRYLTKPTIQYFAFMTFIVMYN